MAAVLSTYTKHINWHLCVLLWDKRKAELTKNKVDDDQLYRR